MRLPPSSSPSRAALRRALRPLALLLALAPAVAGAEAPKPVEAILLVASPALRDPDYGHTVLLAVPTRGEGHIGVILNRPTSRSLASLFPEHAPSKKVIDPVYFGGPLGSSAVFAMVRAKQDPGGGSIAFGDDLFLALRVDVVDRIIETTPNDARYFVGYVGWRPRELAREVDRGVWTVMDADPDLVFLKDTTTLWESLVRKSHQITAGTLLGITVH